MKKINTKLLALLAGMALLLTCTVGGTLAYLTDKTGPVVNTFIPARLATTLAENAGEVVQIRNDGNVDAYVRVAVYGNWVKDGVIVAPWTGAVEIAKDWMQGSDGYYYYTKRLPVAAEGANNLTANLLAEPITQTGGPEGATLVLYVMHQAIQADPAAAAEQAWGVTVGVDGRITK